MNAYVNLSDSIVYIDQNRTECHLPVNLADSLAKAYQRALDERHDGIQSDPDSLLIQLPIRTVLT